MFKTYENQTAKACENTLNSILDIIVEGTWDWNAITGRVHRSPGWYRMLGYDAGIFQEDVFTWENIIHPDDYERVMAHFDSYITGKIDTYCVEYRCHNADDQYIWIIDRGRIIERDADGAVLRMIGAHQNINEQKKVQNKLINQNRLLTQGTLTLERVIAQKTQELEEKNLLLEEKIREIEHVSTLDSLTGIANREKFEVELNKEIARSRRYKHPLSLTIFDLDYFKGINDLYGHKIGDNVLRKISDLVRANIRAVDFFARWGGEEFAIIFPNLNIKEAFNVSEKLRKLIVRCEIQPGFFVTCSFGISQFINDEEANDLFHRADKALYRAKNLGRNRVELVN